jgi:hypothetical protein
MDSECEDDTCVEMFEKCGGNDFNVSVPCCEENTMCVVKNYFYAQCLTASAAEENIEKWGWDGRTLVCEEMPEDLMPAKPTSASRRLMDAGSYGYGSRDMGGYGGSRDFSMPMGGYGAPTEAPGYGSGSRDFTMPMAGMPSDSALAEAPGYGGGSRDFTMPAAGMPTDSMPTEAPAQEPVTAPVSGVEEVKESELVLGEGCTECAPIFGQCGDKGALVSCCGEGLQCTKKNKFYGQCLRPERAARNVENFGWDGAVLTCGEVML